MRAAVLSPKRLAKFLPFKIFILCNTVSSLVCITLVNTFLNVSNKAMGLVHPRLYFQKLDLGIKKSCANFHFLGNLPFFKTVLANFINSFVVSIETFFKRMYPIPDTPGAVLLWALFRVANHSSS